MKKIRILSALLALCVLVGMTPLTAMAAGGPAFTDVAGDAAYADAVAWAAEQQITLGVGAARFAPDAPCTRAQLAVFLWRAAGSPAPQETALPLSDVAEDAYYAQAARWAVGRDLLQPDAEGRFAPDDAVTQSQTAALLRLLYGDAAADRAAEGAAPDAVCTRAQAVLLLCRAAVSAAPAAETFVTEITKHGNLELEITASELFSFGFACGDLIRVDVGGQTLEMPLGSEYSDVDTGSMICRAHRSGTEDEVTLAVNMGNLAAAAGIAEKIETEEAPGYRWVMAEDWPIAVHITMKAQGGYADEYLIRHLERSNDRADYPGLTDAEFANFRAVTTTGMEMGILYRASSPVNPELNRSAFADAAMRDARIRTVLNLADDEETMRGFAGFRESYYSSCSVIARCLGYDVESDEFKGQIAQTLRFMAGHDGPYLVHCKEGKDRTGFLCALLESLMGASADELIADYMVTYRNFFGVEPGSGKYDAIVRGWVRSIAAAFGTDDIRQTDLRACAETYLRACGLTDAEITALRQNLSRPAGGTAENAA